jgi:hypothetical protein
VPTSKRPQINDVQYPRIPCGVLKGASHEEVVIDKTDEEMVEMNIDVAWKVDVDLERMECRDIRISCMAARSLAGPPKACRPQEGLKMQACKHPEVLGGAIRRAPHRGAFIHDVNS